MQKLDLSKFIKLDSLLDQDLKNRVQLIGVELEGGWDALPGGTKLIRDGSVEFSRAIKYIGELPSPPLKPGADFKKWMKIYYPQHVNETCGMHCHMSFKHALTYQGTMRPEFPATIVTYMSRWASERAKLPYNHPIWPRLRGESRFCQHVFQANEQAVNMDKSFDQRRDGHRYTVVNYAFSQHSTVECRLLPMMDTVEQGIEAIEEVIKITNAFLLATATREVRASIDVGMSDDNENDQLETMIIPSSPQRRVREQILR